MKPSDDDQNQTMTVKANKFVQEIIGKEDLEDPIAGSGHLTRGWNSYLSVIIVVALSVI